MQTLQPNVKTEEYIDKLLDLLPCDYVEWFEYLHDPKRHFTLFNDWTIVSFKIHAARVKYG